MSLRRLMWAAAVASACVACAQPALRETSRSLMRAGDYEAAVKTLETGLSADTDSAALRAMVIDARSEAFSRLLSQAAGERAEGRLEDAQQTLKRARAFDSSKRRVDAMLADIEIERRNRQTLEDAQRHLREKRPEAALEVLAEALKTTPRQPELLAMQRRLESDARQHRVRGAQGVLAETRTISIDFRNAGLRTVLDVVTRHSGISFIFDKDVVNPEVTVYLQEARVEHAIDLILATHGLSKKVVDARTVLIYPNTPEKQREHREQVIRVFHLVSAEAKGAAAFLRAMLRIEEPYVDERANLLALRDSPENIRIAERLVSLYDSNEPEVLLDLEVIEVRTSRLTDLGIKFPDALSLTPLPPVGEIGLTLDNLRGIDSGRVGVGIGGLLINFKREVGDFNTLANPRIRARNREKAKILIGDKVPVITTTTGLGGFVSDSVSYLDVGLKLEVDSTVYADDEVAIRVALEVSSIAREVRTTSGSLAYQIGTRNASTLLRLRDGETQLLAGLISNEDRSSASRIPGVGDLPVAGRLFSNQRDDTQRTELVLAITPRILRNIRTPDITEAELWIGTEAATRLKPPWAAPLESTDAEAAPP